MLGMELSRQRCWVSWDDAGIHGRFCHLQGNSAINERVLMLLGGFCYTREDSDALGITLLNLGGL